MSVVGHTSVALLILEATEVLTSSNFLGRRLDMIDLRPGMAYLGSRCWTNSWNPSFSTKLTGCKSLAIILTNAWSITLQQGLFAGIKKIKEYYN